MYRRVVDRLPRCLAFRRVVAVDVAVTDGGDWAPECVLVLASMTAVASASLQQETTVQLQQACLQAALAHRERV
jgi:hypothetical protein